MSQSYTWAGTDEHGKQIGVGSQMIAKSNAEAYQVRNQGARSDRKLSVEESEKYNLITELNRQLSLCMQQNSELRKENISLRNEIELLTGVEGGRRKTKSKRRKSKRRRRRTHRRQKGRG